MTRHLSKKNQIPLSVLAESLLRPSTGKEKTFDLSKTLAETKGVITVKLYLSHEEAGRLKILSQQNNTEVATDPLTGQITIHGDAAAVRNALADIVFSHNPGYQHSFNIHVAWTDQNGTNHHVSHSMLYNQHREAFVHLAPIHSSGTSQPALYHEEIGHYRDLELLHGQLDSTAEQARSQLLKFFNETAEDDAGSPLPTFIGSEIRDIQPSATPIQPVEPTFPQTPSSPTPPTPSPSTPEQPDPLLAVTGTAGSSATTPASALPINTVPAAQITAFNTPLTLTSIHVSDADSLFLTVTLSSTNGVVQVSSVAAGGLTAGGITNNSTNNVTLSGSVIAINATLAAGVTYTPTTNYAGAAMLTIASTDIQSNVDTDTISITVNASANPVLSSFAASLTVLENASATLLDSSVSVTDADSPIFNNGKVTVAMTGGVEDQLAVRNQGAGAGQIGVSGSNVTYGGTLMGTISSDGSNGANLIIDLNANASLVAVQALIQNITYRNISDDPAATRTISIMLDDGTGATSTPQTMTINVTPQADNFVLTAGSDDFHGGVENDTFQGSAANLDTNSDVLAGGGGSDIFSITGGAATIDTATFTDLTGIETFTLTSDAAHSLTFTNAYFSTTGFSGSTITATTAAAGINGVELDASAVSLSTKSVIFTSGNGDDSLSGGAGNDSITGKDGDDSISGGAGSDTISFTAGEFDVNDSVTGGADLDHLIITSGSSNIATASFTSMTGIEYFDFNANSAQSLTLANAYYSTAGFTGTTVFTATTATTGVITIDASAISTATLKLNATGGGGNDFLTGGYGDDTLDGGGGNDRITGNRGADTMTGGAGSDVFIYLSILGSPTATPDVITDFVSGTDQLDFTGMGLSYIHNSAFTGSPNQLRWDVSGSDVVVEIDSDGDSVANFRMTAKNIASLTAADFVGVNILSQSFTLTSGNDNFTGGTGTDQFQGTTANLATTDTLRGGAGSDILQITSGALTLNTTTYSNLQGVEQFQLNTDAAHSLTINNAYYSTAGFVGNTVTVTTSASTSNITVNASGVSGAANNVNITGGDGADTMTGGAGNDTIVGGAGNDSITGNAGNDSLDGGAGNDTFATTFANLTSADTILGGTGTDTLRITSGALVMTTSTTFPNLLGVETISMATNAAHNVTVDSAYFTSTGFSGTTLSLTTSSTTGIRYDASAVSSAYATSQTAVAGNDTMIGGAGNDSFAGGTGNDSITGNDGNDRFTFAAAAIDANDTLAGGNGSDMIYISSGTLALNTNTLTNTTGIETFYLNNNAAHSLTIADAYFSTGLASPLVTVTSKSTTGITLDASAVTTAANNLSITVSTGADTVIGGAGNDTITPSTGNDSINGGGGNDVIILGAGNYYTAADTIAGGTGSDTISLSGGSAAFTLNTSTAAFTGIEAFTLNRNAAHNITLVDSYYISSGFSGDTVRIATSSTVGVTFNASALSATNKVNISSGTGSDTITGGAGNDTITSSTGTDSISAGAGNDLIINSGTNITAADTIEGGAGSDTFQTNAGTFALNNSTYTNLSGIENFALNNNAAHSLTFYDAYFTSPGFTGGTVTVTSTSTTAFTVSGVNMTNAAYLFDITGYTANDSLYGGAGADTLHGGLGNDTMRGNAGNDILYGEDGNDTLFGGAGVDTLIGDNGTDNFYYSASTDSGIGSGSRDIISDFATGDKINLSAFSGTFTFRAGGNGIADFTGTVAQVAYEISGAITIVHVDTDGNQVADFQIELTGNYILASTDFTL